MQSPTTLGQVLRLVKCGMPPLVYQSPFAASTVPFSMANTADDYSKAHPDLKKLHPRTDGKVS